MKTIKNIALFAVCVGMVVAVSGQAEAGCKGGRGGGGHRGGHYHHHYPVYIKPVVVCPPKVIPAGAVIELPGYYGKYPGCVVLQLAGAKINCQVIAWTHFGIKVKLPPVDLTCPTFGKLFIHRWDRYCFKPMPVKVLPLVPFAGGPAPLGGAPGGIVVHPPANQGAPAPAAAPQTAGNGFGQGGIPFQQ